MTDPLTVRPLWWIADRGYRMARLSDERDPFPRSIGELWVLPRSQERDEHPYLARTALGMMFTVLGVVGGVGGVLALLVAWIASARGVDIFSVALAPVALVVAVAVMIAAATAVIDWTTRESLLRARRPAWALLIVAVPIGLVAAALAAGAL